MADNSFLRLFSVIDKKILSIRQKNSISFTEVAFLNM